MIRNTDVLSGLLFVALAAAFGIGALSYRFGTPNNMGAGFLPACLAVVLGLLGVAILLRALARHGEAVDLGAARPFAVVIGSIVLFALLMRPLGFAATAFLTAFSVTYAGGAIPMRQRLVPAVALSIFASVVFVTLLGLPIPVWPGFMS